MSQSSDTIAWLRQALFTRPQHFCHILPVQYDTPMFVVLLQCVGLFRLMQPHVASGIGWLKRHLHVTNS